MRIYRLDKKVLIFKNNATDFLNGLTSNTLDATKNAFLNQQGRIIATCDQKPLADDAYLILIEAFAYDRLMQHMDKFLKLNPIHVEVLQHYVYCDCDGDMPLKDNDQLIGQKFGRLVITSRDLDNTLSQQQFNAFRWKHHIPIHGVDYDDQFILNVSDEFVSFTKGCFLGQELVAKVYHRSKPSWSLVIEKNELTGQPKGFVFERRGRGN